MAGVIGFVIIIVNYTVVCRDLSEKTVRLQVWAERLLKSTLTSIRACDTIQQLPRVEGFKA
jgi:hypothetical protein